MPVAGIGATGQHRHPRRAGLGASHQVGQGLPRAGLQEKGLLTRYYREFVANAKRDPTGYATLQRILGETDMQKFMQKWEKFILQLRTN